MTDKSSFDIAIIGAGIAGAGVAAMLGTGKRILLLEQEERPGYHSTGRSAAIFIQNYGSPAIRALSAASKNFLSNPPISFSETGFLSPRGMMLIAGKDGIEALSAEIEDAIGVEVLTPAEAVSRVPLLKEEALCAAVYEADAQDIDVAGLHQSFLKLARRNGTTLMVNAVLERAVRSDDCWHIRTTAGEFSAETIINASGAWADVVAEKCGIKPAGITPMRRTIAVLPDTPDHESRDWPLVADIMEHWYMKPDAGRLLVSPSDASPVEPHDAYVDDMVLAEGLHNFASATSYDVTRVENQWAGLRSFAEDRNPVVGFDPMAEGFFWLAGQGGYGIQTSPALSMLAADLVQNQKVRFEIEQDVITALDPARFQ